MVQFTDFSSNGRATGVLADTGYAMPAIEYMWTKYSDQLIAAARTYTGFATYERATENVLKTRVAVCFYGIFYYIHQYPTQAALGVHRYGDHRITKTAFHAQVTPLMYTLAAIVNEIHYDDRLHRDNHGTGFLAKRVTTILDGAPIYVKEPCDKPLANMLFSKKYGGCCYKIQVCVPSHVISQARINAPTLLLDWYQFPRMDCSVHRPSPWYYP